MGVDETNLLVMGVERYIFTKYCHMVCFCVRRDGRMVKKRISRHLH